MNAIEGITFANKKTNEKLAEIAKWKWNDSEMKKRLETKLEIEFADSSIRKEYPVISEILVTTSDISYNGTMEIDLGDIVAELHPIVSPHSEDCTCIFVPQERVLFIGDAVGVDYYNNCYLDKSKLNSLLIAIEGIDFDICVMGHARIVIVLVLFKRLLKEDEFMKIVAIGDSITEGYPFSHDDSWVAYVAKELKIEIVNKGVCGDLTKGMRERFKRDVFSDNPTHVIILGGANDALTGFSPNSVSANIKAMVEMSQHQGIIPIVGLPLPFLLIKEEMLMSQYRDWLKHYINRENIMFIDFWAPFFTAVLR